MTEKWVKATFACLCVSMLLQLVAVLSPGWSIITSSDGIVTSYSIIYLTISGGDRYIVESIPASWPHATGAQLSSLIYGYISTILAVTIAGALTTVVAGLKVVLVVQKRNWLEAYTAVSLFCLAITNTLQWVTVASYCNANVTTAYYSHVIFPWCVLLYGLGALLVSGVIIAQGVIFLKAQFRPMLNGLHKAGPRATTRELKDIQY